MFKTFCSHKLKNKTFEERPLDRRNDHWYQDKKNMRASYVQCSHMIHDKPDKKLFDFDNKRFRELLIVFVYDCEKCKREEDDPQSAILYFYPSWVNDDQRTVLCGQLMGIAQCVKNIFSPPSIVSLQSGKFSIKVFGRYILCVGTDRNIPDPVLETRANLLDRLFKFYHCDLTKIAEPPESFPDKLNRLFEIYLPIMMFGGNYFSTIPFLLLPKSGATSFLLCSQMLQYCQKKNGALAGAILYQNKVVISQIMPAFTRLLVLSDPYRIKIPAETVSTSFHMPIGLQLFKVYVTRKQLQDLKANSSKLLSAMDSVPGWREELLKPDSGHLPPVRPMLKRDVSGIFTVPEEEDHEAAEPNPTNASANTNSSSVPDVVRDAVQARWSTRFRTITPASFIIPDVTERQKFATTDSIPSSTARVILPVRYYSLGLPKLKEEWTEDEKEKRDDYEVLKPYYNTITDPVNPFFRSNGLPASRSLFQERVTMQMLALDSPPKGTASLSDVKFSRNKGLPLTPLMSKLSILAEEQNRSSSPKNGLPSAFESVVPSTKVETSSTKESDNPSVLQNDFPSCPSKSSSDVPFPSKSDISYSSNSGLPATALASNNVNPSLPSDNIPSGSTGDAAPTSSNGVPTSSTSKDVPATSESYTAPPLPELYLPPPRMCVYPKHRLKMNLKNSSSKTDQKEGSEDGDGSEDELVELVLCILGRLSTSLMLLWEVPVSKDPDSIHDVWKSCSGKLTDLDCQFHRLLDQAPTSGMSAADSYSFVCLEPEWGTTHRDGSWTLTQLELLTRLHHDFTSLPKLTDIVVRCDDSLVYGNQCGRKEVFYQQSVGDSSLVGLPNPSDLMGIVLLKAKRRLERDHNIVIL